MRTIKFFLKFGQREHIETFSKGNLYFSNAEKFWGIEDKLKIKGQGDQLEAGTMLFAQKVAAYSHEDNSLVTKAGVCKGLLRIEPAQNIPVFCLFAVFEEDCSKDDNGNTIISLSDHTKQVIKQHFPKADAVAIIENPDVFLHDIEQSIGYDVKHELVGYYNLDSGLDTDDGRKAMDMAYINYIMQDVAPLVEDGKTTYTFYADYAFRVLFCKDVYFSEEQEYRILIPSETIIESKIYPTQITSKITVVSIDNFFESM